MKASLLLGSSCAKVNIFGRPTGKAVSTYPPQARSFTDDRHRTDDPAVWNWVVSGVCHALNQAFFQAQQVGQEYVG
ncbi:hypothetical protein [Spirosoma litoris]